MKRRQFVLDVENPEVIENDGMRFVRFSARNYWGIREGQTAKEALMELMGKAANRRKKQPPPTPTPQPKGEKR